LYTSNILVPNLPQVGDKLPSVTVSALATTSVTVSALATTSPTTGRRENQAAYTTASTANTTASTTAQLAQAAPEVKQSAGTSKILGSKSVCVLQTPADVEKIRSCSHSRSAGKGELERQSGGDALGGGWGAVPSGAPHEGGVEGCHGGRGGMGQQQGRAQQQGTAPASRDWNSVALMLKKEEGLGGERPPLPPQPPLELPPQRLLELGAQRPPVAPPAARAAASTAPSAAAVGAIGATPHVTTTSHASKEEARGGELGGGGAGGAGGAGAGGGAPTPAATELQQSGYRAATELQQSGYRAATELQQSCTRAATTHSAHTSHANACHKLLQTDVLYGALFDSLPFVHVLEQTARLEHRQTRCRKGQESATRLVAQRKLALLVQKYLLY
jgi:hypothetical protein